MSSLEAAIITRAINPEDSAYNSETATAILAIQISEYDQKRAIELGRKANEGTLTSEEKEEAECMERVGLLISLLKSKARISLSKAA